MNSPDVHFFFGRVELVSAYQDNSWQIGQFWTDRDGCRGLNMFKNDPSCTLTRDCSGALCTYRDSLLEKEKILYL